MYVDTQAQLSLALVVASVVRDFVVVEERESQFSTRPSKVSRCKTNKEHLRVNFGFCQNRSVQGAT